MAQVRKAEVVWEGDLARGAGKVSSKSTGAFIGQPISWGARTEGPDGKTSPEELLAAAHASCFAMALSHGLGTAGKPPAELRVTAAVTFDRVGEAFKVTSSALEVMGKVPGMDAATFQKAAEAAKDGCPVSVALKGNVQLSVRATLG